MGQKCNPTGLRIGVIKNWDSRWYAKKGEFADTLVEDYNLRKYLLKTLYSAGVPKVEIERDAKRVRINIHCAKPGMVIGKQGAEIEKLKRSWAKSQTKFSSTSLKSNNPTSMQFLLHSQSLNSLSVVQHSEEQLKALSETQ